MNGEHLDRTLDDKTIDSNNKATVAVILAGGSGSRMRNSTPKQLRNLGGIPVVIRTANAFQMCQDVKSIIIVARKEDISIISNYCASYGISKLQKIVSGGSTRLHSAQAGFESIETNEGFVAVHDAARCLITTEQISNIINIANEYGAAIAACSERDTIKQVDDQGAIVSTINRNSIFHAQTPQIFKKELYKTALYKALKDNAEITDDAQMVERCGERVMVVDCGQENIKITYESDIAIAESILDRRQINEVM